MSIEFVNEEVFITLPNEHKFQVGQECILHGLVDFPEHNGDVVTISNIRMNGEYGKAYYIKGRINQTGLNWVYEYRLSEHPTLA